MAHSKLYEINPNTILNVVISGSQSPTIVFLHFWGGSSRTYSPITTKLSARFRTVAVDFRGWGASIGPPSPDAYSITALATDVEDLIQQLEVSEVFLVGHSMGGKVAQLVAGRGLVQDLKAVVLLAPAPPTPLELPSAMADQQRSAYSSAGNAEFVVRNVLSSSRLSEEAVAILVEDMMKGNHFAKLAWPSYAMAENLVPAAKQIRVPVLVIGGGLDKQEPVDRLRSEVLGNIEGSEMVVVEGAGHLLPFEAPSEVAEYIESFVGKLAA